MLRLVLSVAVVTLNSVDFCLAKSSIAQLVSHNELVTGALLLNENRCCMYICVYY